MATDDHSASRRVDVLREEAPQLIADSLAETEALSAAADALEFRLEWLGDYGEREYGADAPRVIREAETALATVRGMLTPPPPEGRTILVHVNIVLPPDAPATADDVAAEIQAACEIAAEDPSGNAPALQSADLLEIALAEEI